MIVHLEYRDGLVVSFYGPADTLAHRDFGETWSRWRNTRTWNADHPGERVKTLNTQISEFPVVDDPFDDEFYRDLGYE